jgi:hypothetical protein
MGKPLENDDLYGKVLKCLKVPKLSLFSVLFLTETYFCLGAMNHEFYELSQWIGSRENLREYLMGKSMVSCRFYLKPIH